MIVFVTSATQDLKQSHYMLPASQMVPQIKLPKIELLTSTYRAGPCPSGKYGKYPTFIDIVDTYFILNARIAA